ncbi:MAG: ACP S-malonyltransferase [Firmicutes bacterium]|nr:ACP S-malonyltransferase [Bacillota bacterium]
MNKLALIFAGQGSQHSGMGIDFIDVMPLLKEKENIASDILKYDIREVLLSEDGRLNETQFTQPLILLSSIFSYEVLRTLSVSVSAVAGFSLGEYTALYASNIFDFNQILTIVSKRSQLMHACTLKHPGKMAAILGLSPIEVDQICEEASILGIVVSANYNSPVQVVISGEEKAVSQAIELAKSKGAKRAVMLNVSGAFHSSMMKEAADELFTYLKAMQCHEQKIPIYMNTTAKPLIASNLFREMAKQVESPVYFEQAIKQMVQDGITHFIEIGPGTVLSGLIKKIDINLEVSHLGKASDLETVKGWLKDHGFNK